MYADFTGSDINQQATLFQRVAEISSAQTDPLAQHAYADNLPNPANSTC